MPEYTRAIAAIAAFILSGAVISPQRLHAEENNSAPAEVDASRTVLSREDIAAKAAFNLEGDIILVTIASLDGAPDGDVVGVELLDGSEDGRLIADKAVQKTVRFAGTKIRKKKSSFSVGVGAGVGARRRSEPEVEGPGEGGGGSIAGGVGIDLVSIYDRKKGFSVSLSMWSLPMTDPARHAPGRWSVAILRQNKSGVINTVTLAAPAPPKTGEASTACRSRARQNREAQQETRTPGSFTVTIIALEGNVGVQRPGSDRWRRARLKQEMELNVAMGHNVANVDEGEANNNYRIQTGLDSHAVVRISGVDAEGEEYEREIFVSPTSQITFTSCLLPEWVFLTGEERREAMEAERNRPHVDIRFGGISIQTTRDVRRTDLRVSTPSCTSGVSG